MTAPNAITPFNFNSHDIRVIVRDGEPWFIASDVAEVLGYRDAGNAGRVLDEDEKGTQIVSTPGGNQKLTIINESGLYALVLRSRKPEARKFAKWVTSEVLPAIRRTGSYESKPVAATPSRTELAMRGATMMSGRVQEEVFQQLVQDGEFVHGRWLLTFDLTRQGSTPRLLKIPQGAAIDGIASIAARIADEREAFNADDLIALAAAATQRLHRDMRPQHQRVANARR